MRASLSIQGKWAPYPARREFSNGRATLARECRNQASSARIISTGSRLPALDYARKCIDRGFDFEFGSFRTEAKP